jgi:hypothetical protein
MPKIDIATNYPDVDFMMERDGIGRRYFRKSGEPITD